MHLTLNVNFLAMERNFFDRIIFFFCGFLFNPRLSYRSSMHVRLPGERLLEAGLARPVLADQHETRAEHGRGARLARHLVGVQRIAAPRSDLVRNRVCNGIRYTLYLIFKAGRGVQLERKLLSVLPTKT